MKLTKFQIKNYKSFIDSGVCTIQDGVTILAGQNESGKTNILDALEKLNYNDPNFSPEEYSFSNKGQSPSIYYWFELSDDDKEAIKQQFPSINLENEIMANVDEEGFSLKFNDTEKNARLAMIIQEYFNSASNLGIALPKEDNSNAIIRHADELIKDPSSDWTEEQIEAYSYSVAALKESISAEKELTTSIRNYLWDMVPKFIVYRTMTDDLPDDFTAADLTKTSIKRLDKYLGNRFKKVFDASGDHQEQMNLVLDLSTTVSDDFSKKYKQKDIELSFDINGSQMSLYVRDKQNEQKGYAFHLSQRSTGLRWYLNFYIALKGEDLKDGDIILIDEPGMYLHPKAQEEMRAILNEESKNNQIIYTTHSPYLIDTNNIGQVRLVEKTSGVINRRYNQISTIRDKVHKCGNIDTIKPIIDAIGYSLGSELNMTYDKVLICEGVSDYYFVKMLEIVYGESLGCGITHANGCGNISKINSLFLGLGITEIFALVDSDPAGARERDQLIKAGVFSEDHILTTDKDPKADKEIEDVLNRDYILSTFFQYKKEDLDKADAKLSKEIKKKQNCAKYTLSKELFDKAKNGKLDAAKVLTEDAHKLFQRLLAAVKGDTQNGNANN